MSQKSNALIYTPLQQSSQKVSVSSRLREAANSQQSVKKLTERVNNAQHKIVDLEQRERSVQHISQILDDLEDCSPVPGDENSYPRTGVNRRQQQFVDRVSCETTQRRGTGNGVQKINVIDSLASSMNQSQKNNANVTMQSSSSSQLLRRLQGVLTREDKAACVDSLLVAEGGSAGNHKLDTVFAEIANKMSIMKSQNEQAIQRALKYLHQKLAQSALPYYSFVRDDERLLKILVMVLYDELEKVLILDNGSQFNQKLQLDALTRQLEEVQSENQQSQELLAEKNLRLNALQSGLAQRLEDVRWMIEECRQGLEVLTATAMLAAGASRRFGEDVSVQQHSSALLRDLDRLRDKLECAQQECSLQAHATPGGGEEGPSVYNLQATNGKRRNASVTSFTPLKNSSSNALVGTVLPLRGSTTNASAQRANSEQRISLRSVLRGENLGNGGGGRFEQIKLQLSSLENEYQNMQVGMEEQLMQYKALCAESLRECESLKRQLTQLSTENERIRASMCRTEELEAAKQQLQIIRESESRARQQYEGERGRRTELERRFSQIETQCCEFQKKLAQSDEENVQLRNELGECLGLLDDGKQNMELLKNALQKKDEESLEEAKKIANLENRLYLSQQEGQEKSERLRQLAQVQLQETEIRERELEQRRNYLQNEQIQNIQLIIQCKLKQPEFVVEESVKRTLAEVFGDAFPRFLDTLLAQIAEQEVATREVSEKVRESYSARLATLEDFKFLGQLVLHASETFARQHNTRLPTEMIMLKEDFDLKRQVITEKLLEANGECSHLREEMHKLNLSQAFFENDISKIEGPDCEARNTQPLASHEEDEVRLSIAERLSLQECKNENAALKQKIDSLTTEVQTLKDTLSSAVASAREEENITDARRSALKRSKTDRLGSKKIIGGVLEKPLYYFQINYYCGKKTLN